MIKCQAAEKNKVKTEVYAPGPPAPKWGSLPRSKSDLCPFSALPVSYKILADAVGDTRYRSEEHSARL